MAPHSSTLAWKIPWTEEPGRLQSMGSLGVGYDWVTSLSLLLSCIGEGNGNPLQYSCLEKPRDGGAWWAAVYGVAQSRTRLKWLSSSSSSSMPLVTLRHVESSQTRDWTHVPCIGRQMLHHWTTGKPKPEGSYPVSCQETFLFPLSDICLSLSIPTVIIWSRASSLPRKSKVRREADRGMILGGERRNWGSSQVSLLFHSKMECERCLRYFGGTFW